MVKLRLVVACVALIAAIPAAKGQDWPGRPVRFIVPFPAGGSTDVLFRILADQMEFLKQHVASHSRLVLAPA